MSRCRSFWWPRKGPIFTVIDSLKSTTFTNICSQAHTHKKLKVPFVKSQTRRGSHRNTWWTSLSEQPTTAHSDCYTDFSCLWFGRTLTTTTAIASVRLFHFPFQYTANKYNKSDKERQANFDSKQSIRSTFQQNRRRAGASARVGYIYSLFSYIIELILFKLALLERLGYIREI